jgi:hypothetical protein
LTFGLPFVTTDESLDRVRLAAIKIAKGDLAELRRQVDVAKVDWRDVINAAEYPESSALGLVGFGKLDKKAQQELQARDREQYVTWLGEPKSRSGGILGKLFSRKKN